MNQEECFARWLAADGCYAPATIPKRLADLRHLAEPVPYTVADTTVRGLYLHLYGHAPEKKPFECRTPEEFERVYGAFIPEVSCHAPLTERQRRALDDAIAANHYALSSVVRAYWRFLGER